MKTYKNVEMFAKNAPTGSYAAGCPENNQINEPECSGKKCEVAQ